MSENPVHYSWSPLSTDYMEEVSQVLVTAKLYLNKTADIAIDFLENDLLPKSGCLQDSPTLTG